MGSLSKGLYTFFRLGLAESGSAKAFGIQRGEVTGRTDANYHHPRYRLLTERLDQAKYPAKRIRDILVSIAGGATPLKGDESLYAEDGIKFLRILNIGDGELVFDDLNYIVSAVHEGELARSRLAPDDVLMTITGRVGSAARVTDDVLPANINQHIVRLRIDQRKCLPQFLVEYLNSPIGLVLSNRPVSGGTRIALDYESIRDLRVPLPESLETQGRLVAHMSETRAARRAKLAEADALLGGLDGYLLTTLGLTPPPIPRTVFGIRAKELTDALNPDRYRGMQLEKHLPFTNHVSDVGTLLDARTAPEKEGPKDLWDWIRIDDLPNQPWQVETLRTEPGENIGGTYFEVQENDILIARLGPTIINAKFVLCPKLQRRTVASSEFLVLRCNANWQPTVALWLLRAKLYRDIMYARSRGATPSRFRLDGDDLAAIPFPQLDKPTQDKITGEVRQRQRNARRLRAEAEVEWQAAKRWFEEQLLGPVQP